MDLLSSPINALPLLNDGSLSLSHPDRTLTFPGPTCYPALTFAPSTTVATSNPTLGLEMGYTCCCPPSRTCSANDLCCLKCKTNSHEHDSADGDVGQSSCHSCTDPACSSGSHLKFGKEGTNLNTSIPLGLGEMTTDETVCCCGNGTRPGRRCGCQGRGQGQGQRQNGGDRPAPVTGVLYTNMARDIDVSAPPTVGTDSAFITSIRSSAPTAMTAPLPTATSTTTATTTINNSNQSNGNPTNASRIFNPQLPLPLSQFYTALIVMGAVLLAFLFIVLISSAAAKLLQWRRERRRRRSRPRRRTTEGSDSSAWSETETDSHSGSDSGVSDDDSHASGDSGPGPRVWLHGVPGTVMGDSSLSTLLADGRSLGVEEGAVTRESIGSSVKGGSVDSLPVMVEEMDEKDEQDKEEEKEEEVEEKVEEQGRGGNGRG